MRYEQFRQPVIPVQHWIMRVLRSTSMAGVIIGIALGIGILGYHWLGGLGWIDAILEASMILGGMGAVAPMSNDLVKLFASAYALFSGLILVATMGILLAPWLHRLLHHTFHDPKV